MKDRVSPEYGRLQYLNTDEYYSGNWVYVCTDDYDGYDIVRNEDDQSDFFGEYRWTHI